ncbi:MAG: hypothetical protein R3224_00880 [Balneolaceae bacterium]|nr:hypothetical protein [Balneolaceae bacterium]
MCYIWKKTSPIPGVAGRHRGADGASGTEGVFATRECDEDDGYM